MDANSSGAHVVAMGLFNWLWGGRDVYLSYEKSFERIVDKTSAILVRALIHATISPYVAFFMAAQRTA